MAAAAGRQPKATLAVHARDIKSGAFVQQVKDFAGKLTS